MVKFFKDEDGQGMLEYVLIIAIVALAAIAIILVVRDRLQAKENDIENELDKAELTTKASS